MMILKGFLLGGGIVATAIIVLLLEEWAFRRRNRQSMAREISDGFAALERYLGSEEAKR